jgi:hypothetical protein
VRRFWFRSSSIWPRRSRPTPRSVPALPASSSFAFRLPHATNPCVAGCRMGYSFPSNFAARNRPPRNFSVPRKRLARRLRLQGLGVHTVQRLRLPLLLVAFMVLSDACHPKGRECGTHGIAVSAKCLDSHIIPIPMEKGRTALPLLAIFTMPGESAGAPCGIITLIWPNGRILWSRDGLRGGPPYYEDTLQQQEEEGLVATLRELGVFEDPSLTGVSGELEQSFVVISGIHGGKGFCMASGHEFEQASVRHVQTTSGIGETRDARAQGPSVKEAVADTRYGDIWVSIRSRVRRLSDRPGMKVDFDYAVAWTNPTVSRSAR